MALTPKEHAIADAATSAAMGLDPKEHGLLFCVDDDGARWTLVTDDPSYLRMLAEANPAPWRA